MTRGEHACVIRPALPADAPALTAFATRLFRETYSDDTSPEDLEAYIAAHFTAAQQSDEIGDQSGAVFLAMSDDRIAGFARLLMDEVPGEPAKLSRIYIDEAWKGRGLAVDLLGTVVAEARQRGATRLQLTVFERNARAIAFYRRCGFTEVGRVTFVVGADPQTDLLMQLDLSVMSDDAMS